MITRMKALDTLNIYQRLKKVKTSDAQARELAEIMHELVDGQLATKNDVKILDIKLEQTKNELRAEIEKTKLELEAKIQTEVEKSKNELRVEIEKSRVSTIKWIIGWVTGLIVAQTGILLSMR